MRKTRGLFKKIGVIKETVHAWMSMIKGRNGKDLTEARKIRRWQEYKEELYQKGLNDQDKHDGVVTHQEPEILECEVKWALVSITMNKASGGDGIAAVPFQILKDDAVKVLHSICQQIWKTQQWPQDWKISVFVPIPKKGNAWRRKWQPTPVLLPGESHGRRSLVGCSPWGRTELDMTEAT